jgi:aminopeptidase N
MRHGDEPEYLDILGEWKSTTSVDGKEIALRAMGRIQQTSLADRYIKFFSKEVSPQDVHTAAMALSANAKMRPLLWAWIKEDFAAIHARLSGNMVVLDRFLRVSLNKFSDLKTEKEISEFFESKNTRGYNRTLDVVSDTIKGRAAYKERDRQVILEWLQGNGFA